MLHPLIEICEPRGVQFCAGQHACIKLLVLKPSLCTVVIVSAAPLVGLHPSLALTCCKVLCWLQAPLAGVLFDCMSWQMRGEHIDILTDVVPTRPSDVEQALFWVALCHRYPLLA
jgi:hypothetical protein